MTLLILPDAPDGFSVVIDGVLNEGDLVYSPCDNTWGSPTCIDMDVLGMDIPFYYAVARSMTPERISQ